MKFGLKILSITLLSVLPFLSQAQAADHQNSVSVDFKMPLKITGLWTTSNAWNPNLIIKNFPAKLRFTLTHQAEGNFGHVVIKADGKVVLKLDRGKSFDDISAKPICAKTLEIDAPGSYASNSTGQKQFNKGSWTIIGVCP